MGKQHELLAVESDKKNVFEKIVGEVRKLMQHSDSFIEFSKTYKPFDDDDKDVPDEEHKAMVTTVKAKLEYAKGAIANFIDVILQKEKTNQEANASIIIYDESGNEVKTIAEDVPVSALLQFEKILNKLRNDVYIGIPTIDTNVRWDEGTNEHGKVWMQKDAITLRKIKDTVYETVDVGEKHPKVVKEKIIQRPVGNFTHMTKSGALSPYEKSQMLGRIDTLIEAVKKAKSKANSTDVIVAKCGLEMMNYING